MKGILYKSQLGFGVQTIHQEKVVEEEKHYEKKKK